RAEDNGKPQREFDETHTSLMADLTQVSIHKKHERFLKLLEKTVQYEHPLAEPEKEQAKEKDGVLYMADDQWTVESSEEYAIYTYPQALISRNSNKPFFVASPKLFTLMFDNDSVSTISVSMNEDEIKARKINLNGKTAKILKLGEVADVKHGMTTGDNKSYIHAEKGAWGNYKSVDHDKVLTESEMEALSEDEWYYGFDKSKFDGKFLIPHDKGGQSDTGGGWLPKYHVPTQYYLRWDSESVEEMMKLVGHRHDNPQYYGLPGLTFSPTGYYAPTFRLNSKSVFG